MSKTSRRNQSGFTIIELVVVILLLGILTATALPRFLDVTDAAHDAVVQGTLGGLGTGVGLFRAQWVGNGQPTGTVIGFGSVANEQLVANLSGYPVAASGGTAITDGDECAEIFVGLLQAGRPSSSTVAGTAAPTGGGGGNIVYTADFSIHADDTDNCSFVYTAQGSGVSSPRLTYSAVTGAVALDGTEI